MNSNGGSSPGNWPLKLSAIVEFIWYSTTDSFLPLSGWLHRKSIVWPRTQTSCSLTLSLLVNCEGLINVIFAAVDATSPRAAKSVRSRIFGVAQIVRFVSTMLWGGARDSCERHGSRYVCSPVPGSSKVNPCKNAALCIPKSVKKATTQQLCSEMCQGVSGTRYW